MRGSRTSSLPVGSCPQVTFRFGVGSRFVVLTLHGGNDTSSSDVSSSSSMVKNGGGGTSGESSLLERWDEEDCGQRLAEADLRRVLMQEDVPPYLELPLLSSLHSLHLEEVRASPINK